MLLLLHRSARNEQSFGSAKPCAVTNVLIVMSVEYMLRWLSIALIAT
jgi:hypothetical protein